MAIYISLDITNVYDCIGDTKWHSLALWGSNLVESYKVSN